MAMKYAGDSTFRYFKTKLVALFNAAIAAETARAEAAEKFINDDIGSIMMSVNHSIDEAAAAAATAQSTADTAKTNAATAQSAAEAAASAAAAAKLAAWPIGSVMFCADWMNPGELLGGTWTMLDLGMVQASYGVDLYAWKRTA